MDPSQYLDFSDENEVDVWETDCPDLRTRILAAISSVPCERCRQRPDYKPSDCETHTCRQMYEQEADAVISVLPQSRGLSLREQAIFLCIICRYGDNPETCPINLMRDLKNCPFEQDCENLEQWAWLPILEKRLIPETNR